MGSMDPNNDAKLLAAAELLIDGVIRHSIIIYKHGQIESVDTELVKDAGHKLSPVQPESVKDSELVTVTLAEHNCSPAQPESVKDCELTEQKLPPVPRNSILRKNSVDCGRTSPAAGGHKISWASDVSDSSHGSVDSSFPFAIHPRCEDLIREDKQMFAGVHPLKNQDRSSDRFVRTPSPLCAGRASPLSTAPVERNPGDDDQSSSEDDVSDVAPKENEKKSRFSYLLGLLTRPFRRAKGSQTTRCWSS
ncbi:uncharacterized protein LOC134455478 [Engraulis encrasicolus]|uniref:uncharacterized protein LOC134455478 n=1 Tax=Engraulis encrasicolus TaxID=184585 RepID=UPI002FD14535